MATSETTSGKVRITVAEDHELFEARSTLLSLAARAGSVGAQQAEGLARRAFDTLATLCGPEFSEMDYTTDTEPVELSGVNTGLFCGECSRYIKRGPFTVIVAEVPEPEARWLCVPCAEVFELIVGHNYATGECGCNGDARHHGYLTANGDH